jgi:hypothetical protein
MSMKNSNYTIGNRTRDLPACSSVPQPTAPPRTSINTSESAKYQSPEPSVDLHCTLSSPLCILHTIHIFYAATCRLHDALLLIQTSKYFPQRSGTFLPPVCLPPGPPHEVNVVQERYKTCDVSRHPHYVLFMTQTVTSNPRLAMKWQAPSMHHFHFLTTDKLGLSPNGCYRVKRGFLLSQP